MKDLLESILKKLTLDEIKTFGIKHGINLSDTEYNFILDLVQKNFDDLVENENKYLDLIESKINPNEFKKIKQLFLEYKNKYGKYLF